MTDPELSQIITGVGNFVRELLDGRDFVLLIRDHGPTAPMDYVSNTNAPEVQCLLRELLTKLETTK